MNKIVICIWLVACLLVGLAVGLSIAQPRQYANGVNRATDCMNNGGVIMSDNNGFYCWYE